MKAIKNNTVTFRDVGKLPTMPSEMELPDIPNFAMQKSQIFDGKLIFDEIQGFDHALNDGFFLVKCPNDTDLTASDKFANNFYKERTDDLTDQDNIYRGYRTVKFDQSYQGYFDRPYDQWENFYIEMGNWNSFLPRDVASIGHKLTDLGICILRNILAKLEIPKSKWSMLTSGLTEKNGHQMLAFNHFRSCKTLRGSKFHRDSGWVTVLRSTEPGLVAIVGDRLYSLSPEQGYLTVNFGSSLEVLTSSLNTAVRANIHGVARTVREKGELDRTSYVVFLDSNLDGDIYKLTDVDTEEFVQSVVDFAKQEVSRTYDDDNLEL